MSGSLTVLLGLVGAAAAAGWPDLQEPMRSGASAPEDAAVVIGLEDYPFLTGVPYARRDARAFQYFLQYTRGVPADRIQTLSSATPDAILRAVQAAASQAGPGGVTWVYFAGHGAGDPETGERLLVGDTAKSTSAADFVAGSVPVEAIKRAASMGQAPVVLVLDACYNGLGRSGEQLSDQRFVVPVAPAPPPAPATDTPTISQYTALAQLEAAERAQVAAASQEVLSLAAAEWLKVKAMASAGTSLGSQLLARYIQDYSAVTVQLEGRLVVVEIPEVAEATAMLAAERALKGPLSFELERLEAGRFEMGSPADEPMRDDDEEQHTVKLTRPFYISETEVTQGLWREVMGGNPAYFASCGLYCPVENISWFDAVVFCNTLSQKQGLTPAYTIDGGSVSWDQEADGWRLPTEAEWEYAARAGEDNLYAGSNDLARVGWVQLNSGNTTHPVGLKAPNAWGLFDMTGSVLEWTWDRYDDAYQDLPRADPVGGDRSRRRVFRGSAFSDSPEHARVANRGHEPPETRSPLIGLRIVRFAEESP